MYLYLQAPGAFKPLEALKAIDKMIVMGALADPKLLKAAADAHHKASDSISCCIGVTSKADWDGVTAQQAMRAVDKTIVLGGAMDGNLLNTAAEAHHKAIGSIDGQGVTSAAYYEAVNAALGRIVASVPTSKTMHVYNAWVGLLNGAVPNKLFSMVNPLDANAMAKASYDFKDVVKASQR